MNQKELVSLLKRVAEGTESVEEAALKVIFQIYVLETV